jgi:hypothetical protein
LAINIISRLVLRGTIILLRNLNENLGGGWMAGIQFPWKGSVDRHTMQLAQGTYYLG